MVSEIKIDDLKFETFFHDKETIKQIKSALKLEELVEEEIKEKNSKLKDMDDKHQFHAMPSYYHQQEYVRDTLQSLMEKSKESKE